MDYIIVIFICILIFGLVVGVSVLKGYDLNETMPKCVAMLVLIWGLFLSYKSHNN